jgi:hypothetical protein
MPVRNPKVLFIRTGTDANSNDFRHSLIYSKGIENEYLQLISEGMDPVGSPFREEWEASEDADGIVRLLTRNEYLSLTRAEFEGEVLPKLTRVSPTLATEVRGLIDGGSDFIGDW